MVYVTGDKHAEFTSIEAFCRIRRTTRDDILVVLGDCGINYYRDERDVILKQHLAQLPITLFCVHGNHEVRPSHIPGYQPRSFCAGTVFFEPRYPNILFPLDGTSFLLDGRRTLVIGGAYSIDKFSRLLNRQSWFDDEQPTEPIKRCVELTLDALGWNVDAVLSHTCPARFLPKERELYGVDPKTIDYSTEEWLGALEKRLNYNGWFCGHFHLDKREGKCHFVYNGVIPFVKALEGK